MASIALLASCVPAEPLLDPPPHTLEQRWFVSDVNGTDWDHAATGDGRLYVLGGNGQVVAIELETGWRSWSYEPPGTARAVTASQGGVFVGASGGVGAANAGAGQEVWRFGGASVPASPAVDGDRVFFSAVGGSLTGVDRLDGEMLFTRETEHLVFRPSVSVDVEWSSCTGCGSITGGAGSSSGLGSCQEVSGSIWSNSSCH